MPACHLATVCNASRPPLLHNKRPFCVQCGADLCIEAFLLNPLRMLLLPTDLIVGVATLTIPRRSTTATLKVLRAGVGKVKSRTGRWTDYSSVDITMLPPGVASTSSNEAAGVSAGSAHKRVHFGVQWSQRVVQCLDPSLNSTTSGTQLDASNSADLVSQQSTLDASSGSRTRNSHSGRPTCAMPSPWLGQLLM